jgi:glycosyltransferase involved in cell wall biosynthesis
VSKEKQTQQDAAGPLRVLHIVSDAGNIAHQLESLQRSLPKTAFTQRWICLAHAETNEIKLLRNAGAHITYVRFTSARNTLSALRAIGLALSFFRPHVVHTQFQRASLLGLVLAWLHGVRVRISTRHHSDFNLLYHPKQVWQDRLITRLSTKVVAVSSVVKNTIVEQECASPDKVLILPNALDARRYTDVPKTLVEELRRRYNPKQRSPVIGISARWEAWKGIQFTIPAYEKLLQIYPNALLLLANATPKTPFATTLQAHLASLPTDSYQLVGFELDNHALYKLFDIFVHVPISPVVEAFGQIYTEALAAGIPQLVTLSGVAVDILEHGRNAYVVPYQDSEAIYQGIIKLLTDDELRNRIATSEREVLLARFSLKHWATALGNLYLSEAARLLPHR